MAAKIEGLYELGFIPPPQPRTRRPLQYLRRIAARCHRGKPGLERLPRRSSSSSGIAMTAIPLWMGLSHWFLGVIAMTYDFKIVTTPPGPQVSF